MVLFLAWQLWWHDAVMAAAQQESAASYAESWEGDPAAAPAGAEPPVQAAPAEGDVFGVLYVPRFGTEYRRAIAEGIGEDVLNSTASGIGHYPGAQMPGEVGNFAIASHRSANGGGMHVIEQFQLGDPIVVQTVDGWYTYRFRNFTYVQPDQVDAIAPVPGDVEARATDRLITLTTCNPLYSTAERIIAYGTFESFQPATDGAPGSLAGTAFEQGKDS